MFKNRKTYYSVFAALAVVISGHAFTANAQAVTYSWQAQSWGACLGGTQTAVVACKGSDGNWYADSFCASQGPRPTVTQSCVDPITLPVNAPTTTLTGFWGSALTNPVDGDYIPQTAPYSNIAVFGSSGGPTNDFKARILEASSSNMHSVPMMQAVLFQPSSAKLYTDYQTRFNTFWNSIPTTSKQKVVGFYLVGNPYYTNSIAPTSSKISETQLKADLQSVALYIKLKAPNRPVMMMEHSTIVDRSSWASLVPDGVDQIGLYCFMAAGCTEAKVVSLLSKLSGSLKPYQKLVVFADGYTVTATTTAGDLQMKGRILFWENILKSYFTAGKVGTFMPFLYQPLVSNPVVRGVSQLPITMAELGRYMITVRAGAPTPLPPVTLLTGAVASASSFLAGYPASNAIDASTATMWNSGGVAPKWLQINLSSKRTVSYLSFKVAQSVPGLTVATISTSETGAAGTWNPIAIINEGTVNGQVITRTVTPRSNVRYIKVESNVGTSWPAWYDIKVMGW